jgi:L-gulonate 3-dehydrogenase
MTGTDKSTWHDARPVALVGAGSIGIGWAIVFARAGVPVRLFDVNPALLASVPTTVRSRLQELADNGLLDDDVEVVLARISITPSLSDALEDAIHVQENVIEDKGVKASLFADLDRLAAPDAVLASSTSSIPVSEFASDLASRGRCLVAHPANPPHLLPIVELVPSSWTHDGVVEQCREMMQAVGQEPVTLTREITGFVYNRLQGAVLREAYSLLRDGIMSVEEIDQVMTAGLGLRWSVVGPFETADLNYRGGLREHARRMAANYQKMAAQRGQIDVWEDDLVAEADRQRRALIPMDQWSERVAWRDKALMGVMAERRKRLRR